MSTWGLLRDLGVELGPLVSIFMERDPIMAWSELRDLLGLPTRMDQLPRPRVLRDRFSAAVDRQEAAKLRRELRALLAKLPKSVVTILPLLALMVLAAPGQPRE